MRLIILGGGESGVGAALLAQSKGYDVFVSDSGTLKNTYKAILEQHHIPWEEGVHTEEVILDADEVIKSPGIPDETPIVSKIIEQHIPIISEIEFASRYTDAKMICITGSNGKTTTTSLIYYIMSQAHLNVGLAGNIGHSLACQVMDSKRDYYVIELSSFQLDNMFNFRADVAVLLNITPDHLDRYGFDMQRYTDSKMRIIQNQRPTDTLVYWAQDDHIEAELNKRNSIIAPAPTPSSMSAREGNPTLAAFCDEDFERLNLSFSQIGRHNKRNALAAYYAAKAIGIDEDIIRQSLISFRGVEHRLEKVGVKHGVTYINDSKATNVDACRVALEAVDAPIILILGGKDKGNDYTPLFDLVAEKCRALVFLGADNRRLHQAFDHLKLPTADTHSMDTCVSACSSYAQPGDTVLLSPCCASFDLFRNMEDRGDQFRLHVNSL